MSYHTSSLDIEDVAEPGDASPPQWMIDCIAMNPSYCGWGAGSDYMSTRSTGWDGSQVYETFSMFADSWSLMVDDLNEIVNFHFELRVDGGSANLAVHLWMIHPRKGASRGIRIDSVTEHEARKIRKLLIDARNRNAERFERVEP